MRGTNTTVEPTTPDAAEEASAQENSGAKGDVGPTSASRRSAFALKLITFIGIAFVVGSLHAFLAMTALSAQFPIIVLPFLEFVAVRDVGSAFSFVQSLPLLQVALYIYGLINVSIIAAIFSALVKTRYLAQYIAIHIAIVSLWLMSCERLLFGATTKYFIPIFGPGLHSFAFSLPQALAQVILFLAYPFALIKFFRSRTAPLDDVTAPGDVADPYFEMRRPLKGLLVLTAMPLLLVLAFLVGAFIAALATREGRMQVIDEIMTGFEALSEVVALSAVVALLVILWRLIPTRAVDVAFLRAFQDDRAATRTLKSLRKALGSGIRLTGVTDPKDLPRLVLLPLYLYFPFFFVLGDFARANAFRHTIFLVGHWKDGVRSIPQRRPSGRVRMRKHHRKSGLGTRTGPQGNRSVRHRLAPPRGCRPWKRHTGVHWAWRGRGRARQHS